MSLWTKLGIGVGATTAFFGRRYLTAHYQRGIQYATDAHIKFVGGGLMFAVLAILANFGLVYFEAHGAQTILALSLFVVSLYYLLAPFFSAPLTVITTASEATSDAQQGVLKAKTPLGVLRDGLRDVLKIGGIMQVWVLVYIVGTMLAPFDLYPAFFWFVHIFIALSMAFMLTGHIHVNPKIYVGGFWISVSAIVIGVFTVAAFREQLGPWWTEHTASQAARVEAKNKSESIRKADKTLAEWEETYVRINDAGEQLVIVDNKGNLVAKSAEVDGTMRAEDAAIEKAKAKARKERTINKVTGKSVGQQASKTDNKKDGAAQLGKSDCRYWEPCYWVNVAHKWSEEWGVPLFLTGFLVIIAVLVHFIPLIWGGKVLFSSKNNESTTTVVATSSATKNEKKSDGLWWWDFLPGWVRIGIFAVIGLFGYTLYAGTGWFYDLLPNQQQVAKVTVRPNQVMDQVEAPHFRAFIRNTDHPYHGQALTVEVIDDRGSYALVVNTPDKTRYLLRNTVQNRPQIYADGVSRTTAGGLWENGVINGTYEASLSAGKRVLTLRSPKLGEDIVMELRRVS